MVGTSNLSTDDINLITSTIMSTLQASGQVTQQKTKRARINWERLLAFEYVGKNYGDYPHWFRIEVGPIPGDGQNPLYARTRRWADAVIRMPDHMIIIEFKMKANPDVASQLLNYRDLYPQTPLFSKYKDEPVKLVLVAALVTDDVRAFVERQGIEVVEYRPANFDQWYKQVVERSTEA